MSASMPDIRAKTPESEKITINLGFVDLGHVDLLVSEGFYGNRTDFIRTAIRNQLGRHGPAMSRVLARRNLDLGLRHYGRAELEAVREAGEVVHIRVLGLVSIGEDVTPDLARDTIASVAVLGAFQARPAIKDALRDRTR